MQILQKKIYYEKGKNFTKTKRFIEFVNRPTPAKNSRIYYNRRFLSENERAVHHQRTSIVNNSPNLPQGSDQLPRNFPYIFARPKRDESTILQQ